MKLLFLCALLAGPALAHEDTSVEIAPDGSLLGLPVKYEPGRLTYSAMALRLRLGDHETILPPCLTAHLGLAKARLDAYASWYHRNSPLPAYLGVNIVHGERRQGRFDGFTLLFNLETATLMDVTRLSVVGNAQRRVPVDVRALCKQ